MGVKQGCPLSATLFGLFVDGLEQHLMDTVGHDAPSLSRVMIPLLLYADDLIIMSTTAAGLQRQLDALQQFCHQRQLSVNLAKTKVVTFGSKAACQAFVFNSNEVERVHATKTLAHGVSHATHSMNRRCALLPISDPEVRCKPFESLELPVLSYASEAHPYFWQRSWRRYSTSPVFTNRLRRAQDPYCRGAIATHAFTCTAGPISPDQDICIAGDGMVHCHSRPWQPSDSAWSCILRDQVWKPKL